MINRYSYPAIVNTSSLVFDGNDDYVNIPDNAAYVFPAITIECWIKWDGVRYASPKEYMALVAKGSFSSGEFVILMSRFSSSTTNTIYFYANGSVTTSVNIGTLDTGWHHIAATYDGVTAKLYMDGVLRSSAAVTVTVPDTTNPIRVGSQASGNYPFGGAINGVRVWNVARTLSEIQASMNIRLLGNEVGLLGNWRLDEDLGISALDYSPYANNGAVTGATYSVGSPDLGYVIDVKEDWLPSDTINAADFNRIEANARMCRDYIKALQYAIPTLSTVLSRDQLYVDYLSGINRIEQNIDSIRANFVTPPGYLPAETWVPNKTFSNVDANRLEIDIKLLMDYGAFVYKSFRYCGATICGGGGIY